MDDYDSCIQMAFRGVRSSKFRHVYGSPARKHNCYENIRVTKNAHDSCFCAVNPKFVAIVTETAGGGSFLVLPLERSGRLDINVGKITGHSGPVLDVKWNPFNDSVIASGSDDCTIKLWHIPDEGLKYNLNDWLLDLHGHKRRVGYVEWHPTAENILLSAGFDHMIIVWNIGKGEAIRTIEVHPDVIYSMSFNRDGSLLATTCKDKKIRVIDPRSGLVITEGRGHPGTKASKVVFLGDKKFLFTTGFSTFSDREYGIWDQYDLRKPLRLETIDSSSGVVFPYYDHDTKIVFLAGKGDGNIRYYEIVDSHPWCHFLNEYKSGSPQRGLGFMPKRGLDVNICEIFRFYKLHATKGMCEPISMIVPRKSDQFQEDLYPDTAGPTSAMTAEEWIAGRNANPIPVSMKQNVIIKTHKPVAYKPGERKLILSDPNMERKFKFIAEETRADYRDLNVKENEKKSFLKNGLLEETGVFADTILNMGAKFQHIQKMWGSMTTNAFNAQTNGTLTDVVVSRTVPTLTFASMKTINSSGPTSPIDQNKIPFEEAELKHAFLLQQDEIIRLQQKLIEKDKKIIQLENELKKFTNYRSS